MATSQQSFEALIGRFKAGNTLLQSWVDFLPSNPLIQKAALATFVTDVEAANMLVASTKTTLDDARAARHALVFIDKDTNPSCLDRRIMQIATYLEGEVGKSHPAAKFVRSIRKKMRPKYAKKPAGTPRGAGTSPMERSNAAAVGQAQEVISRITALGVAYKPADNNLKVPGMTTIVDQIIAANQTVSTALDNYGNANRARKALYDTSTGIRQREVNIKGYLTSFSGGKKSNHYIEYAQAVKGS